MNTIVTTDLQEQVLTLSWSDGHHSRLAADWLRDNCACAQCRHSNGQKLFNINELDDNLHLLQAQATDQGLTLTWSDQHITHLTTAWLIEHDLHADARRQRRASRNQIRLWGAELGTKFTQADWHDFDRNTATEKGWLAGFLRDGFGLLTGVPNQEGMVATVGDRLGHVRVTNYGRLFDVRSVPDPNNLADTSLGLSVHSDNPYRHPSPGVQLLHCLVADAPGGDTLLVDGFACAEQLRQQDPEAFTLLHTWPMLFRYRNATTDLQARQTLISVDAEGDVTAVHFNNRSSFFLDIPEHLAGAWYKAYRKFAALLHQPDRELIFRLEPGTCVVMQNDRTLHGRTAFDPNLGRRLLQGCYIDIDAMRSRLAVLRR